MLALFCLIAYLIHSIKCKNNIDSCDSVDAHNQISQQILSFINFYNDLGNVNKENGDVELMKPQFYELVDNFFHCDEFESFCIGESDSDCKYEEYKSCADVKTTFWEINKNEIRAHGIGHIDIRCEKRVSNIRATSIYSAVINNENLSWNQELKFNFVYVNSLSWNGEKDSGEWKATYYKVNSWPIQSSGDNTTPTPTKSDNTRKKPHILLMFIDDLGFTDISHNNAEYETPNIDNLIETGIELTNYYTHADCSPTRSALLTGQYSFKNGLQYITTIPPGTTQHIPIENPTLPELLKEHGYINHMIGKWHQGYASFNMTPTGRGFDSHYGFLQGGQSYYNHNMSYEWFGLEAFEFTGYDFFDNREVVDPSLTIGVYTEDLFYTRFTEVINAYVISNQKDPMLMYMSFQTIHNPIVDPPILDPQCDDIPNEGRRIYCYKMSYIDYIIGEIIDLYKDNGLWDDTLLIISTDNGGIPNWSTDSDTNPILLSYGCNMPYRAGKATLFEGGIKAIGAINGGNNVIDYHLRGTTSNKLSHVVDFVPTIIEGVLNEDLPQDVPFDGINLWDIWTKPYDYNMYKEDRVLYIDIELDGAFSGIIDAGKWKYIQAPISFSVSEPIFMLYSGYYPCDQSGSYGFINETEYLFNLQKDPYETKNLAKKYPMLVQKYKNMINDYVENRGYREEQDNKFYLQAAPHFYDGVWYPFLD